MHSTTSVDCFMFIALLLLPTRADGVLTSAVQLLGDTSYPGGLRLPIETPYWEYILREFIFKTISPPPPGNNNLYKRLIEAPFYGGPFPVVGLDGKDTAQLLSRGDVYRLPNGGWIMCQEGCTACEVCQELKDLIRPTVKWAMRRVKRPVTFARSRYDLQLTVSPQDDDSFHMRNLSPSSYVYVTSNSGVLDSLSKALISQDKGNLGPHYPFGVTKLPGKITQSNSSLGKYKPVLSTKKVDNVKKADDDLIATKCTTPTSPTETRTSTLLPINRKITTSGIPETTDNENTSPVGKNDPVTSKQMENTTKKVDNELSIALLLTTSTLAPKTQTTMWLPTTANTATNVTLDNMIGSTSSKGKNSSVMREVSDEASFALPLTTSTLAPETQTSMWLPTTANSARNVTLDNIIGGTSSKDKNSSVVREMVENITKEVGDEVSFALPLTTSTLAPQTQTSMWLPTTANSARNVTLDNIIGGTSSKDKNSSIMKEVNNKTLFALPLTTSTLAPETQTSMWLPTTANSARNVTLDNIIGGTSSKDKNSSVVKGMMENITKEVGDEVSFALPLTTSTLSPEIQTSIWLPTTANSARNITLDNIIGGTSLKGKNSSFIREMMENITKDVGEELSTGLQLMSSTLTPETQTSTWFPTKSGAPNITGSTSPPSKKSTETAENVTKKVDNEVSIASQLTTSTLIPDTQTRMRIPVNRKRGREILSDRRNLQIKVDHSGNAKWTTKYPRLTEAPLTLFHPSRVSKVGTIDADYKKAKDSRLILGTDQFGEKHLVHIVPAGDLGVGIKTPSVDTKTELFYQQPQSHLLNASESTKNVPKSEDRPLYRKIFRRVMDSLNANKIAIEKFLFSSKRDRQPGHLSKDEGEPAPVTSNYSRNILGTDIDLDNPKSITHPLENGDAVPRDVFDALHSTLRDASSSKYNPATPQLKHLLKVSRERPKSKPSLTWRRQPERKPASKQESFENRVTENVTARIADNDNGTKSSTVFNETILVDHISEEGIGHTVDPSTSISTITVSETQDEKLNDHRYTEPDVIVGDRMPGKEEDPIVSAKQRKSSDSLILKEVARSVVNHASTPQEFAAMNSTRSKIREGSEHSIGGREKDHRHT